MLDQRGQPQRPQQRDDRLSRTPARHVGPYREVLVEADVAAVWRVKRVDDAPLRGVEVARAEHLGAGVERQVDLAQLRQERVEREPREVLDQAWSAGALLGTPLALERRADTVLHNAVRKQLLGVVGDERLEVVLVRSLVVVVLLVDLHEQIALLHGEVLLEQVAHQPAGELHPLVREAVAVSGGVRARLEPQHPHHHVPDVERLVAVVCLSEVRQQVVCQDVMRVRERLALCERPDEPHRGLLREELAGMVHARAQPLEQDRVALHVQQAERHDVAVGDDAERAQEDEQWERLADVGHEHDDLPVCLLGGAGDNRHGERARWLRRVLGHGADVRRGGVRRAVPLADVERVVCELFLADDDLLLAADDEVAARVVAAFAHAEPDLRVHAL